MKLRVLGEKSQMISPSASNLARAWRARAIPSLRLSASEKQDVESIGLPHPAFLYAFGIRLQRIDPTHQGIGMVAAFILH